MRKITKSLDLVKQEIEKLKGQNIKMQVNLGRKKLVNYEGVVEDIYNSVFVVSVTSEQKLPHSCSYPFFSKIENSAFVKHKIEMAKEIFLSPFQQILSPFLMTNFRMVEPRSVRTLMK